MSKIKRLSALLIAVLLVVLSTAACNANATWIMKVDGEETPVGVYICYLMQAQNEAQTKVDEDIAAQTTTSDKEDATQATTEAVDYYKQKVEDKSYTDWIKDEAVQRVKEHIVIKEKFEEYKLSLTDEQLEEISSVWETSVTAEKTYGDYYELNGVSRESFEEFAQVSYKKSELMKYYYGEDGVEPVSEAELTKKLTEDYATAYILSQSKTGLNEDKTAYETYSDDILSKMKKSMDNYIKRLDKKEDYSKIESDFKAEMNKILGIEETAEDKSNSDSATTADEDNKDELKATPNIQLRAISDDTDEVAAALKKAKVGKAGLAESDGVFTVYQKTNDLTKNPYYLDAQKQTLINDLKGDDFDKLIEGWAKDLKIKVNDNATSAYGPKELKDFE